MAGDDLSRRIGELEALAAEQRVDIADDISRLRAKLGGGDARDAWSRVQLARNPARPSTLDYLGMIADRFMELHGDRLAGDDAAIVGGIAVIGGIPFTVIGHQKGRTMKENLKRNYGMAHPEGYRKALRLAQQAERFGRTVVTFIDTPGANPGIAAEERGISEAIARNLRELSRLRTPIVAFIIGEGGSGGALGIGIADRVFMLENGVYSVISPEGFASILLRKPERAREAAGLMKMTAADLRGFGLIDGILGEGPGAHEAPDQVAAEIRATILATRRELSGLPIDRLLRRRSERLLHLGATVSFDAGGLPRPGIASRAGNGRRGWWTRMTGRG